MQLDQLAKLKSKPNKGLPIQKAVKITIGLIVAVFVFNALPGKFGTTIIEQFFTQAHAAPSEGTALHSATVTDPQNCTTLNITNYSQYQLHISGYQCPGGGSGNITVNQNSTITLQASPYSEIKLYNNYASNTSYSTTGSASQLTKVSEEQYPLRIGGILGNEKYGSVTVNDN